MKKILLSIIILILSYYPVYALRDKDEEIVANGEIITAHFERTDARGNYRNGLLTWIRYKGEVYFCHLETGNSNLSGICLAKPKR